MTFSIFFDKLPMNHRIRATFHAGAFVPDRPCELSAKQAIAPLAYAVLATMIKVSMRRKDRDLRITLLLPEQQEYCFR